MPRPPKKPRSSFSSFPPGGPPPASSGSIDRGLVRPEWKEKLRARAEERAKFERPGARLPAPPPRPLTKKEKSKLWDPFMIWAPTPEQIEEARAEAERISRFHEAIVPEAEREYVKAQAEAWRRGEKTLERPGYQQSYSSRYQSRTQQTPAAAPTPVPPPKLEVTPEYLGQVFNLDKMFDHVRDMRKDPRFKSMGNTGSVGIISPAGMDAWGKVLKTTQFFGIPEANFSRLPREEVWDKVIKPFLDEVERVLNSIKPPEIPGRFKFEGAPSGVFGLLYTEK